MTPQDPRSPQQPQPGQPPVPGQSTQPLEQVSPGPGPHQPALQGQATQPFSPPVGSPPPPTQPPVQTGAGQPPPQYQAGPGQPVPPPGGAAVTTQPAEKVSLIKAFMPEPGEAPPLEWAALAVGLALVISGLLPWATGPDNLSVSGLDGANGSGDGLVVLGAGLASMVMGFFGLSRHSIALAAGQALIGLITLIFAIINLSNPGEGRSVGFGLYLAIVASVLLIALSLYNAFDARRKGAKY